MGDIEDGGTLEVMGSAAKPYVLANKGGLYSCSCPAWRNQSIAIEKRTCKHLRGVRGAEAEDARVGGGPGAPPPLSPPKAKATAPKDALEIGGEDAQSAKGPPLLLAHSWMGDVDLTGWWMSEKLDGVRAYWDGKQFLSRLGNPYFAPDWFVAALPDVPLDGELWSGRKKFQRTISIVRRQDKSDDWKEVSFVVFDAPALKVPFEERLAFCRAHVETVKSSHVLAHEHLLCEGINHVKAELARVEGLGGEGLMMRQPGSAYEVGRSSTLLKIKTFHDAEARVLEHLAGAGKHKGRLGALLVELPNGAQFSVGTGFSDAERKDPPAVGSIITFRYQELSEAGVPRFPSYVCVRTDAAWPVKGSAKVTSAPDPVTSPAPSVVVEPAPPTGPPSAPAPAPAAAPAPAEKAESKPQAKTDDGLTQPPKKAPEPMGKPKASKASGSSTNKPFVTVPGVFRMADSSAPDYPDEFEIAAKAVLQHTDIKSNHNKYYAIEIHRAEGGKFRVFTHYGRTDDLETNPGAGARECRYFGSLAEAEGSYQSIYGQKTRKGYQEISLASSRIGSQKARGASSGDVDDKTLAKISRPAPAEGAAAPGTPPPAPPPPPEPVAPQGLAGKVMGFMKRLAGKAELTPPTTAPSVEPGAWTPSSPLTPQLHELVSYIYGEATTALTTTVAAKITANGIETPLGVLTIGQIEKGEALLQEIYGLIQKKHPNKDRMIDLSGDFYTVIPHRLGRTRAEVEEAVIDSMEDFEQKQETLQLMKDMLAVNGEAGDLLFKSETQKQYEALRCDMSYVDPESPRGKEIANYVLESQIKSKNIRVVRIFTLKRDTEWSSFTEGIENQRLLFHGSRIRNWVGILSRGILMPKVAVSMGINRTDAGWLGNGIYFGDAACTSGFYTTPGRKKTRLMGIARVALGKMKNYTSITYGLSGPPAGFDSCHGVRARPGVTSQFQDDEYVIYNPRQHRLETLVEFMA